jgi:hypothetical protein
MKPPAAQQPRQQSTAAPPPGQPKQQAWPKPIHAPPARPSSGAPAPPPAQPTAPLDPVGAAAFSAAAATQPAHRPPDQLVDPNLLPPPKPKPKPKPQQVAVVCKLCGTRMYASLEKIGQTIQCPDCHSIQEIKAPAAPPAPKKSGPSLDDAPDIGLSEPVERPKYKPIVKPRDEDAILSELPGADHPPGWAPPEAQAPPVIQSPPVQPPASSAAPAAAATNATAAEPEIVLEEIPPDEPASAAAGEYEPAPEYAPPEAAPEDEDPEITLEAPVDRVEIKPEMPKTYLQPDAEEERMTSGRYHDDDLIGAGGVNHKSPDAWKKAPFLLGLFEFLLFPSGLSRWVLYGLGAGGVLVLLHLAVALTMSSGLGEQLAAIFVDGAAGFVIGMWLAPFAASLLAILEDTANGRMEVESWPDWSVVDWFIRGFHVGAAAFVSGLPGILATILLAIGGAPLWALPLPVVASWTMLFPMVMYSMLAENSVMTVFSNRTRDSFHRAADAWMLFWLYSLGLGIVGGGFAALAAWPHVVANLVGGFGLVTVAFLYCRLLGRLMWYAEQKIAKRQPAPARA